MNFKTTLLAFVLISALHLSAQTDSLRITYDATLSGTGCQPLGANKMYFHSGAGTSSPVAAWEHPVGNYGQDDGLGQMQPEGTTDVWTMTIHLYDYYDQSVLPPAQNATIYAIGAKFRNENASMEGMDDDCSDIFIRQLETATPIVENTDGSPFDGVTVEWVIPIGISAPGGTFTDVRMFPNPFTNAVSINYTLNEYADDMRIVVYNTLGQAVKVLYSGAQLVGTHNISWDGRDAAGNYLGNGVYLLTISNGSTSFTSKLMKTN